MTKDEIIFSLMDQLKAANEQIAALTNHAADLTAQIIELTARLGSIEQSFKAKDDSLKKEQRKNKGLTKLIRNEGEQQTPPKPELTDEEKNVLEEGA